MFARERVLPGILTAVAAVLAGVLVGSGLAGRSGGVIGAVAVQAVMPPGTAQASASDRADPSPVRRARVGGRRAIAVRAAPHGAPARHRGVPGPGARRERPGGTRVLRPAPVADPPPVGRAAADPPPAISRRAHHRHHHAHAGRGDHRARRRGEHRHRRHAHHPHAHRAHGHRAHPHRAHGHRAHRHHGRHQARRKG